MNDQRSAKRVLDGFSKETTFFRYEYQIKVRHEVYSKMSIPMSDRCDRGKPYLMILKLIAGFDRSLFELPRE